MRISQTYLVKANIRFPEPVLSCQILGSRRLDSPREKFVDSFGKGKHLQMCRTSILQSGKVHFAKYFRLLCSEMCTIFVHIVGD